MPQPHNSDVLIIGAGMAGLTAARALLQRGLRVTVLEARDRVGGRVHSEQHNGQVVELGAEFVHGRPPELWSLIEEAGLETVERDGTMLRARPEGLGVEEDQGSAAMFEKLDELTSYQGPDQTFAEWINNRDLPDQEKAALHGFVEGFNAADSGTIGILGLAAQQRAEDEIEGDRAWHIRGGYSQLPEFLAQKITAAGAHILLEHAVQRIDWAPGEARITCSNGQTFAAPRCILTLPLGVLQQTNTPRGIAITPEPESILAAARQLEMGTVFRATLLFRNFWWHHATASGIPEEKLRELSFLFTPRWRPSVWWTPHPEPSAPMLTAWVGGPAAMEPRGFGMPEVRKRSAVVLSKTFSADPIDIYADIISVHTHDWDFDPFSLGAYSYIPVGAIDAPATLATPVQDTLFFAGEHTDTTANWGTVHAAIRSGLRAADQLLAAQSTHT